MTFHLALNMAGAVSAGAYTAGVLDFLIEALDEWYDARETQRALHGDDFESWTIPAHEVKLDVLSGASAGGMCAAISAVALQEIFDHVHQTESPMGNRLYESWVRSIDILPLLGTADLPPAHSLLDSTPVAKIAVTAIASQAGREKKREWVAERLRVILTLSNLRGIPYSVNEANAGSFEERIAYHADRVDFTIPGADWAALRTAAMATGAVPVMLAAQTIERARAEYENRLWNDCGSISKIPPAWDDSVVPPRFENVYVDGGVTNNNPFECAREALAQAAGNGGRNPRAGREANAAVITIAPFPGEEPFDPAYDASKQSELPNVLKALISTLVSQSRFQGEDLRLTKDPDVLSRFAIAPVDNSVQDLPALLCGSLGAFGGFIDQKFRDRDYQLGRRNCQQFLRKHLAMPEGNAAIGTGVSPAVQDEYSFVENGTRWYPVIPLMPSLRGKIPALPRDEFKTTEARLEQVASAAAGRLKAVLHALAEHHAAWSLLLSVLFDLGGSAKVKGVILDLLTDDLKATGQV